MTTIHAPGLPKAAVLLDEAQHTQFAATSTWHPNNTYRFSFRKGMSGWDVWAIQVALNGSGHSLVLDGAFGPLTDAAVRAVQTALHVTVDGIMGPQTQAALCAAECARAELHLTPKGLLKGICFGESGGIIPATSTLYPNGSRDYGPLQDNLLNPSDADLREAFNVRLQAREVGVQRLSAYDFFHGQPGAQSQEEAWRLAVLSYNWPAAANKIAAGLGSSWTYTSEGHQYKLADPAPWIERIGVAGVSTGWEWAKFYIDTKVVYVTSWSVS
jgi:hypothetical protein